MQNTKIDSTLRLYLLTEKLRLDTALSQAEKEELQKERLLLGRSNPTLVAQTAMETATQFRMNGKYDRAIDTYEQALALDLSPDFKEILSIELSDLYIERSEFSKSKEVFERFAVEQSFDVELQISHVLRLEGQLEKSEEKLNALDTQTEEQASRKSQLLAQILTDKGDPSASEEWQKVSENSSDTSIRYNALYNKAQLFLQKEKLV